MSEQFDRARLDEIKARADAATGGRWEYGQPAFVGGAYTIKVSNPGGAVWNDGYLCRVSRAGNGIVGSEEPREEDVALMAAAREDVPTMLTEIERAWGEIEARTAEREEARDWVRRLTAAERVLTCVFCGEAYPPGTPDHNADALTAHVRVCAKHPMREVEKERDVAVRRLAHDHDAASALYRAASDVCSEDSEKHATIPGLIKWFRDLKSEDDYGMSEDLEAGCKDLESVLARLRAAIDPALAETQRRDGLDEQVRTLTADRDEWRRTFLGWVCGMVSVERCRCGAPATVTDCTTLGEHGAYYCPAHLGECDMRGTWIATGERVWTDRGEAVSQ